MENKSKIAFYLFGITGGIATAISVVCLPFIAPGFRRICLPYVPATTSQVMNVLKALRGKSGSLVDLGSGDGRIVLAAAKAGFIAHGIELNRWLVYYSKMNALRQGLLSNTSFFKKDLWSCNLHEYDNIVVFGVEEMMNELENKFQCELKPDTSIVVCRFPLPNHTPITSIGEGVDTVWIYKTPLHKCK